MTDNEIIKALECCVQYTTTDIRTYKGMPLEVFSQAVLDLINRRRAEIERLQEHNNILICRVDNLVYECDCAKQEAIKEFAEQLKKDFCDLEFNADTERKTVRVSELRDQMDWVLHTVSIEIINDLVKEMTEEQGNDK